MNYIIDFSIKITAGRLFSPSREFFAWVEIHGSNDFKVFTRYSSGAERGQQELKKGVMAHIKTLDNPVFWVDAPWEKALKLQKFLEIEEDFLCFRSLFIGRETKERYYPTWHDGGNYAKCKFLKRMLNEF